MYRYTDVVKLLFHIHQKNKIAQEKYQGSTGLQERRLLIARGDIWIWDVDDFEHCKFLIYRDSIERAKAKLVKQLTAAVRTTMAIEDTITSRLETLFEQTMREDDEESVSEVASLPEAEDSIPEGFRRRQGTGMLASSTPAVPAGARARGRFSRTLLLLILRHQICQLVA